RGGPPAATTTPSKSCGSSTPCGVMKLRSTTAVAAVGLKSEIATVWSGSVEPDAKYQSDDVVPAHGALDQPSGPSTDWVTSTPPPLNCRLVATHAPDRTWERATATSAWAAAETAVVRVAPLSVTTVMLPVVPWPVVFSRLSVATAADPAVPDPPAQYQAEDSTSAGATAETGRTTATGWAACGRPRSTNPTPASSSTSPITSEICIAGRRGRGLTAAPRPAT